MQTILADLAVSMSEFKKKPELFEAMMEEIADQDLYQKVLARMADKVNAIEVDLDDL